ncbi:hypothetical protein LR48_Vigan02g228000 [Vigna angularis]|uniref:Cyclin C-terminal domain-containing protein n=1 Tax=Phaseolus angularis TaxID=3914 RepID=A0A0L9U010_PHAAN|nr:hypothetical protein LR48_Vigan02g228000 [Vigna angularis]
MDNNWILFYSLLNKFAFIVNIPMSMVATRLSRLRSSLWLQFKPHHIAAGAAYLAAKFLNIDLTGYQNIWQEFQTTPTILQVTVNVGPYRKWVKFSKLLAHRGISPDLCGIVL